MWYICIETSQHIFTYMYIYETWIRDILKNGYSEVVSGEASFKGCNILRLRCRRRWGGQDWSSAGGSITEGCQY